MAHLKGSPENGQSEPTPPPVMLAVKGDGPGDGELFGQDVSSISYSRRDENPRFAFYQLDSKLAEQARELLLQKWNDRLIRVQELLLNTRGITADA